MPGTWKHHLETVIDSEETRSRCFSKSFRPSCVVASMGVENPNPDAGRPTLPHIFLGGQLDVASPAMLAVFADIRVIVNCCAPASQETFVSVRTYPVPTVIQNGYIKYKQSGKSPSVLSTVMRSVSLALSGKIPATGKNDARKVANYRKVDILQFSQLDGTDRDGLLLSAAVETARALFCTETRVMQVDDDTNDASVSILYLSVPAHDEVSFLIRPYFDHVNTILCEWFGLLGHNVSSSRDYGSSILFHCMAGRSRSVAVLMAFLVRCMFLTGCDSNKEDDPVMLYDEVLDFIRKNRVSACPNEGFRQQLLEYISAACCCPT